MNKEKEFSYYEFFAGGGMARAGLGGRWQCLFANDNDEKKAASYSMNWGNEDFLLSDVAKLSIDNLPGQSDLAWASFPCQDLSLAGVGAGIRAERSGTFWPFWKLIRGLNGKGRGPKLIVLENVYGALTSHEGKDFAAIASAFSRENYRYGAVVIDAVDFLPQSRPRLFVIGVHPDVEIPDSFHAMGPILYWHPRALIDAYKGIPKKDSSNWIWWNMRIPSPSRAKLIDIIEESPEGIDWHTQKETRRLLSLMTELNRNKVKQAKKIGTRIVGTIYKRTRNGQQRAEVRFDNIAGCLRTPSGGSSRQTILVVEGNTVRSRLLSPREAARLMGLPDNYILPSNYNAAYHLAGDGVAVPVVRYIAENILNPILDANRVVSQAVA